MSSSADGIRRHSAWPVEPALSFGLHLGHGPDATRGSQLAFYRSLLDDLGDDFTHVWVGDHFEWDYKPILEGWTRATYLAALYPRLAFGHYVIGQRYRNPALLARMATTLQHLSDGRFVMGIGAGWLEREHLAYGYDFPSDRERVEQLEETIRIMRAMWTSSPTTFHGKHYSVHDAYCIPGADPDIPILVGASKPRGLAVAARTADAWSWNAPLDVYLPPLRELERACEECGRDPASITLTCGTEVSFPARSEDFVPAEDVYGDPEKYGPYPEQAVEALLPLVELGVRHFMVFIDDRLTLERFQTDVAPVLREAAAARVTSVA